MSTYMNILDMTGMTSYILLCLLVKLGYKVYNWIRTGSLRVDSNLYFTYSEVFMTNSFLHNGCTFEE